MASLDVSGLRKSFGPTHVLHGIDLAVEDGEMIVIVGASGCGKSTLLRIVAGLETATSGSISVMKMVQKAIIRPGKRKKTTA